MCIAYRSLYSAGNKPRGNPNEIREHLLKNAALIYIQLGAMIDELIEFLGEDNLKSFLKASRNNQEMALSIMKTIFKLA